MLRHLLTTLRRYGDGEKPRWDDSHITHTEAALHLNPTMQHRGAPHHEKLGMMVASTVHETFRAHGYGEKEALARADAALHRFRRDSLAPLDRHEPTHQTPEDLTRHVTEAMKTGLSMQIPPFHPDVPKAKSGPEMRQDDRIAYRATEAGLLRDAQGRFAGRHGSVGAAVAAIAPAHYDFPGNAAIPTRDQIRQHMMGEHGLTPVAPPPRPKPRRKKVLN